MKVKAIAAAGVAALTLVLCAVMYGGLVGHNDIQNWQVYQSPLGHVSIIDAPGYYFKAFGTVWTYPRSMDAEYTAKNTPLSPGDDSIRATFNDGGTAQISSYVAIGLPLDAERRLALHQRFSGRTGITAAVKAHLENCIKTASPVMSASENQASRKSEFNQIIEEQLAKGLFKMRRTEIELNDLSTIEEVKDEDGNKVQKEKKAKVQATEIVTDKSGNPVIVQPSPLAAYDVRILQFSVTDTDYDPTTLEQFAAKKKSYLAAEQAKAERQQEVQQRLMVEEKGRRQVADVQAEENQKKERATIQANQAAEVAVIRKSEAVTAASQKTEVAEQTRLEALKLKDIALIKSQTAELEKAVAISVAQGKQKEIELGGGISEEKRVLAEIDAKARVGVAEALSKVNVPSTVIVGGNGDGGNSLTENLLNLALLKSTGVLKDAPTHQGK